MAFWSNRFMQTYALKALVTCILLVVPCLQATAQPIIQGRSSIEFVVLNAELVVVGKLVGCEAVDSQFSNVTIAAEETIKGRHRKSVKMRVDVSTSLLDKWQESKARLLITGRDSTPLKTTAQVIDLSSPKLSVLKSDLTVLLSAKDVVKSAKKAAAEQPGVSEIRGFRIWVPFDVTAKLKGSSPHVTLLVPVNKQLEKMAHKFVTSNDYGKREEAAEALRYFKSSSNIARVKKLLTDKGWAFLSRAEYNDGVEVRVYGVRKSAYETLQYWGIDVPQPVLRSEHEDIGAVRLATLSNQRVTAEDLTKRHRFYNVDSLFLWNSKIADGALVHVGGFKNLRDLYLGGTKVNDAELKHFAGLKKLAYIDLDGTLITDAGLKQLAQFKSLKKIDVKRTKVTSAGVAALKKQRPDLKIGR